MKIFISGGAKNGKSFYAQDAARRLARGGSLYYLATMEPRDAEDDARVLRHRREREGWGFVTWEWPRDLAARLPQADPEGTVLLDSATALLANEMFSAAGTDASAGRRTAEELLALAGYVKNIVVVSDYIYADAADYDPYTEMYRRSLAAVDRACAGAFDVVLEACTGQITVHKGAWRL